MKTNILRIILILSSVQLFSFEPNGGEYFVENKGQWDESVQFFSKVNGLNVWITKNGILYDKYKYISSPENNRIKKGHVFKMNLVGANTSTYTGLEKLDTYYNYFFGRDTAKWKNRVPLYKEVQIKNIYNGIDIKYYYEGNNVRYDFIVNPGADPNLINIYFSGQDSIEINNKRELEIKTEAGTLINGKIAAYQIIDCEKELIPCSLAIRNNNIVFIIDSYEKDKELIIDPLIYSSYITGERGANTVAMSMNNSNHIIIAGYTESVDYPTTEGAYQEEREENIENGSWNNDIFFTIFSNDYSEIKYSTFLGGNAGISESLYDMGVDNNNNIILLGRTKSAKFPVTENCIKSNSEVDSLYLDNRDLFITKFNSSGTELLFSTYFGGRSDDDVKKMAIDCDDNIIFTGSLKEINGFPITNDAICKELSDGPKEFDTYVSKISQDGTEILFSTLLGTKNASAYDLVSDSENNIYLTGSTRLNDFPITNDAILKEIEDSIYHCYLIKISNLGDSILYSTFLGNYTSYCTGFSLHLDLHNNIYISGYSDINYPVTENGFKYIADSHAECIFLTKFDIKEKEVVLSNVVGGTSIPGYHFSNYVRIDLNNNIYVTGKAYLRDYPFTDNAFQPYGNLSLGEDDGVVMMFSPDGKDLLYCSGIGGTHYDELTGFVIDDENKLHICGNTWSFDLRVTNDAKYPVHNWGTAGFICKFDTSGATSVIGNIANDEEALNIYPNPAKTGHPINIKYEIERPGRLEFRIYDCLGNEMDAPYGIYSAAGAFTVTYTPDSDFPPGVYFMRIVSEDGVLNQSFVVE